MAANTVTGPLPDPPLVPTAEEAEHRYYGLPSQPRFVARSSHDIWVKPTGMEAYLEPVELRPVGKHPIHGVWEGDIDTAMHTYLVNNGVRYTSLDPVRIGKADEVAAPVIVWVGVEPGSLSPERGVEVAVGLRALLVDRGIDDVHVEIRESVVNTSAKMYKPALTSNATAQVREAFSTSLGIPICAEATPDVQGTATLFFTASSQPKKLFLLAARHVLFPVDEENEHYQYRECGPRKNVLLLGTNGFAARTQDIEQEIKGTQAVIDHLKRRLQLADQMEDPEEAEEEREDAQSQLDKAERTIRQLEQFLVDVKRDWEDPKKRILGHVVLSPPLILGRDGFTQDLAVIEVDTDKVDVSNFVGNAIDLGTKIPVETFTAWMRPSLASQPSFKYPGDRLLRFRGILSYEDVRLPNPNNVDERGDPTMVAKRGCASGLTVGRLNDIHSVVRTASGAGPEAYSKAVTVLPRASRSGAFSEGGDSGAAVIDGLGAIVGILTGGSGSGEASDCTYVTPVASLLGCLERHGFAANIFPVAADVFA